MHREAAASNIRLSEQVRAHMRSLGDDEVFFTAVAFVMTSAHQRIDPLPRSHEGKLPSDDQQRVVCSELECTDNIVFAVTQSSIYLLPAERILHESIVEFVVHAYCEIVPGLALEIRVGNPDGSSEVRVVAFQGLPALRDAIRFAHCTSPGTRILFHGTSWLVPSNAGDDPDAPFGDTTIALERLAKMKIVRANLAASKLNAYHRNRSLQGYRQVTHLASFGPGHYTKAADALAEDLQRMEEDLEHMLQPTSPSPPPSLAPLDHAVPQSPSS